MRKTYKLPSDESADNNSSINSKPDTSENESFFDAEPLLRPKKAGAL